VHPLPMPRNVRRHFRA